MTLVRRRERTSMSFLRHEEIYRSDVGLGEAGNGNGCCRSQRSSAAMSFQSAIPSQGALQQSLPPLHRLETILNNQCCRTMIFQRTATTPLIPCLSPRVHFKAKLFLPLPSLFNALFLSLSWSSSSSSTLGARRCLDWSPRYSRSVPGARRCCSSPCFSCSLNGLFCFC